MRDSCLDIKDVPRHAEQWAERGGFNLELIVQGIARTQSPTSKNDAPESPTFGVIAPVSPLVGAMSKPHDGGTTLRIMVSPAPGKYALLRRRHAAHRFALFQHSGVHGDALLAEIKMQGAVL